MHKTITMTAAAAVSFGAAAAALAGDAWPQSNGPMWHIMIDFDGSNINVTAPLNTEPMPLVNYGEAYTAPADVLDGKMYNDEYGWLAGGIFTPPSETAIWILETSATEGLETYQGGMRPVRDTHTYAPIFTDIVTPWMWNGTMTHNWYAVASPGAYEASYEVYIGDLTGVPLPQYGSDTVTLHWSAIPTPGTAMVLLGAGAPATLRRRRR